MRESAKKAKKNYKIENSVVRQVSCETNQVLTTLCEKVPKKFKKTLKTQLSKYFDVQDYCFLL